MPGAVVVQDDLTVHCQDHGVVGKADTDQGADSLVVEHLDEAHPEVSDE